MLRRRHRVSNVLDLPEDILRLILLELHNGLLRSIERDGARHGAPSHYLVINKRLHSLARPIWGRILLNPPNSDPANVYLHTLSSLHGADCVLEVDLVFTTKIPALYFALISQLRNLKQLKLDMEMSWTQGTATHATARLATLTLYDPTSSDDPHFSLERDVPSLRILRAKIGPWLTGVVSRGVECLHELVYLSEELHRVEAPHTDVEPSSVALRSVALGFLALNAGDRGPFTTSHLLELFDVLDPLPLRDLVVKAGPNIALPTKLPVAVLPSLESLSLVGPVRVHANLASLATLLRMLRGLKEFVLVGAPFADATSTVDTLVKLSPGERAIRFPHLTALLAYLPHSTQVIRFTYMRNDTREQMRWTRPSVEEEFVGERWTLF
ncbi:hypothetical protein JCM10296v2_000376 [Rhodotorula toruloides]